jgi:hypothetical protein
MQLLLGFLALIAMAFLGLWALVSIWAGLTSLQPQVLGPLLVASGTIVSVSITVVVGQLLQRRAAYEQAQRPTKVEIYERFMTKWFDFLQLGKAKDQRKPVVADDPEMVEYFAQFAREVILWGSGRVLADYSHFTAEIRTALDEAAQQEALFSFEKTLLSLRIDVGHSNRGVKQGDVLRLFITDIDQVLAARRPASGR